MASFTLNNRNVAAILKAPTTQALLVERANRIAHAADSAANAPRGHKVVSEVGSHRARAAVITATPKAMYKEATVRSLTSSLGAGRG